MKTLSHDGKKMPENVTQKFLDMIKLPNPDTKRIQYLFVMPRFVMQDDVMHLIPYGFCLVSSALKASGRDVFTLNLNYKADPYDVLQQMITNNTIDVVFTGGLSGQYTMIKEILDMAKSIKPSIITCVGGGIITADPVAAMEALETADYGIIGEGEIAVNAFAYELENNGNIGKLGGIVARDGSIGPPLPEIQDLDVLPFPDYDGFEYNLLLRGGLKVASNFYHEYNLNIATSRSCPYNCTFCFHSSGKKYRRRSIGSICSEIDWILRNYPSIKSIYFVDEQFIEDIEFLKALTDYVKKRNLRYVCLTRVDYISKEKLQILKDSGCSMVGYGVESADNRILKSMRKNITVEQINQAFDLALEVGLEARGNLIFGDPEETPESINTSLDWWKKHPEYKIVINWINTFPGSHLYQVACERGVITDRAKYLKDNKMQINLTKMPDDMYWDMVKRVALFQTLSTNDVDVNFDEMDCITEMLRKKLEILSEQCCIAIWPVRYEVVAMLNEISPKFVASKNVFFVNINPADSFVSSCESFGKKVHTPDDIFSNASVDIVLYAIGNKANREIYNQISQSINQSYSSVKRLLKITELLR